MNARKQAKALDSFPCRIEGLAPPIWLSSYISESRRFHKPSISCLLCSKVKGIIDKVNECHKSTIDPTCSICQKKTKNAPYLDRGLLTDLHSKYLHVFINGQLGGDIKPLRAKAWSDTKNTGLEDQMRKELSRFSRTSHQERNPRNKTKYQPSIPDSKVEQLPSTPANKPNQHKKAEVNLIVEAPSTETIQVPVGTHESVEQKNLIILNQTSNEQTSPDGDNVNQIETLQENKIEAVASLKSSTAPEIKEIQPDKDKIPPTSVGEDLEEISWIDDEPWVHAFYVGGAYPQQDDHNG